MHGPDPTIAVYQKCQGPKCNHSWVDLSGRRNKCVLCGSTKLSRPKTLQRVSSAFSRGVDTIELMNEMATLREAYEKRLNELLKLKTINEPKSAMHERALESLVLTFSIAHQLNQHEKATRLAHIIGLSLIRRSKTLAIRSIKDFADLETARLWFELLDNPGLIATVNMEIAQAADTCFISDCKERFTILQLGYYHGNRALEYFTNNRHIHLEQLQNCITRINQQLCATAQAMSYVQGSRMIKDSLKGISDAVYKLAKEVRDGFSELSSTNDAGFEILSNAVVNSGNTVASSIHYSSKEIAAANFEAGNQIAFAIDKHSKATKSCLSEGASAISDSVREVGENCRQGLLSLGDRIAFSTIGAGALHAAIIDDEFEHITSKLLTD